MGNHVEAKRGKNNSLNGDSSKNNFTITGEVWWEQKSFAFLRSFFDLMMRWNLFPFWEQAKFFLLLNWAFLKL
jgi:hypothetical protein